MSIEIDNEKLAWACPDRCRYVLMQPISRKSKYVCKVHMCQTVAFLQKSPYFESWPAGYCNFLGKNESFNSTINADTVGLS